MFYGGLYLVQKTGVNTARTMYCFRHPWQTLTKSPLFRQYIFRTVYHIFVRNLLKKETNTLRARAATIFFRKIATIKYWSLLQIFRENEFKKTLISLFSICLQCTVYAPFLWLPSPVNNLYDELKGIYIGKASFTQNFLHQMMRNER